MGDDPRRLALAGQAVAGLPGDVAEQHVDLEVLLERLPLRKAPSNASRSAPMASVKTWSSIRRSTLPLRSAARLERVPDSGPLWLVDVADRGVATLTLNNPAERNTLTAPMVAEIVAAMDAIEADEAIGAIVVTGAPPAFCAGANLGNLAEADGQPRHDLRGLPAHRPQPAADARRGQRRRGRGRA